MRSRTGNPVAIGQLSVGRTVSSVLNVAAAPFCSPSAGKSGSTCVDPVLCLQLFRARTNAGYVHRTLDCAFGLCSQESACLGSSLNAFDCNTSISCGRMLPSIPGILTLHCPMPARVGGGRAEDDSPVGELIATKAARLARALALHKSGRQPLAEPVFWRLTARR